MDSKLRQKRQLTLFDTAIATSRRKSVRQEIPCSSTTADEEIRLHAVSSNSNSDGRLVAYLSYCE